MSTNSNKNIPTVVSCSVVVPSHGGAHRLPELLEALSQQNYENSWELIIVLDGVIDESETIIASFVNKLPLRVIRHKKSLGSAYAMNTGIANATGRIIIRCDDDLTPSPTFITNHMEHHDNGYVGVIGLTRDVFPKSKYARIYGLPSNEKSISQSYTRKAQDRWISWAANNSAPRELLNELGGFDTSFLFGQDSELGYRLLKAGLFLVIEPRLEISHRGPATSIEARVRRAYISGASKRAFKIKHPEATPKGQNTSRRNRLSLWDLSTKTCSNLIIKQKTYSQLGRFLDNHLEYIPDILASKLIAFLVETAALSGNIHSNGDLSSFKNQKQIALKMEMNPG